MLTHFNQQLLREAELPRSLAERHELARKLSGSWASTRRSELVSEMDAGLYLTHVVGCSDGSEATAGIGPGE